MPFTFAKCPIEGLWEVQPKVFGDKRGYFFEVYSEKDFHEAGLPMHFVQDNQSASFKGVLRGLHFQKKHPQGKLVRAVNDSEKQNQFYIPEGFAHGFYVLSKTAVFAYKCTDFYHPEDEGGIMWNDPAIGIDWKGIAPDIEPLLSEKDTKQEKFCTDSLYFDLNSKWIGG